MLVCPLLDLPNTHEVTYDDESRSVGSSATISCANDSSAVTLDRTCLAENGWGDTDSLIDCGEYERDNFGLI